MIFLLIKITKFKVENLAVNNTTIDLYRILHTFRSFASIILCSDMSLELCFYFYHTNS